ncbi:MAG: hypothetical protein M3Q55_17910 [Acidobacteriota bacterium]|nr:hypothetical protein [Acidobacteriota bacterium]
MQHGFLLALILPLLAAGALAAAPAGQHSYLVTVIAESGEPVTSLTAADFTVKEGSTPLNVVSVEHSRFPLIVSLLVDTTQPTLNTDTPARELRAALSGFAEALRAAGGSPRIALVEVGSGAVTRAGFDAPFADLDAAIQKIYPAHPSDAVMLDAIGGAARSMNTADTPRRAVVTVDFNSSESLSEGTMKTVTGDLAASGATLWSVSVRLPRAQGSRREGALNMLTKSTGGQRLVAGAASGLPVLLKRVADSLASQYIVTFERDGNGPPKGVEMSTASGLKVRISPMRR